MTISDNVQLDLATVDLGGLDESNVEVRVLGHVAIGLDSVDARLSSTILIRSVFVQEKKFFENISEKTRSF